MKPSRRKVHPRRTTPHYEPALEAPPGRTTDLPHQIECCVCIELAQRRVTLRSTASPRSAELAGRDPSLAPERVHRLGFRQMGILRMFVRCVSGLYPCGKYHM